MAPIVQFEKIISYVYAMFTTRRYRKIKKPGSNRKQRRTRRKRGVKGGTLSQCIEDCDTHKAEYKMPVSQCIENCHKLWPADPLAGLPTMQNPTDHGWYITMTDDRHWGQMYVLHNILEPDKSVYESIPRYDGGRVFLHEFKNIDLPILGYISSGGYVLSIDQDKLVWKRVDKLMPYLYNGEEPKE
jgi:hypothetical protein